jgi:hypothetical protein
MAELEISVNVLVDAKKEYTKKLVNLLALPIYQGIQSIYEQARQASQDAGHQNYLRTFQILLRDIPQWNQDVIDTEHNRIVLETKCNWLTNLIKAVFISHVKVLSAVRMGTGYKRIKLNVPSSSKFVHTCYVEAARVFYKNPYLFYHEMADRDVHKNMVEAISLIKGAIKDAIERLIPFQQIIYEYVDHPEPSSSSSSDESDNEDDEPKTKKEEGDDKPKTKKQDDTKTKKQDDDSDAKTKKDDDDDDDDDEDSDDDELDDFDQLDMEQKQQHHDSAIGTKAAVEIPQEQRQQVKNITIPSQTGARAPAQQQVIHHRIRPEDVGNVDLSGYQEKIAEDGAVFFPDAEDI